MNLEDKFFFCLVLLIIVIIMKGTGHTGNNTRSDDGDYMVEWKWLIMAICLVAVIVIFIVLKALPAGARVYIKKVLNACWLGLAFVIQLLRSTMKHLLNYFLQPLLIDKASLHKDIQEKERRFLLLIKEKKRQVSLFHPRYEYFDELFSERSHLENYIDMKNIHVKTIAVLLKCYQDHLTNLLTPTTEKTVVDLNQKEQYKMYGLLKSASISGFQTSHESFNEVKEKIIRKHHCLIQNEHAINGNVQKSLSMTWSMLTLLPPLLVVTTIDQYNEQLHDTNRHTWEEDNGGSLYYYRPILVYGNQLHVAVKGLVGNKQAL